MRALPSPLPELLLCSLLAACAASKGDQKGVTDEPLDPTATAVTPAPSASPDGDIEANEAPGSSAAPTPAAPSSAAPNTAEPAPTPSATSNDGGSGGDGPSGVPSSPDTGNGGTPDLPSDPTPTNDGGTDSGIGGAASEAEPTPEPESPSTPEPAPEPVGEPEPTAEPTPFAGECPTNLEGWATVSGDGVNATSGGGDAATVRPSSAAELMDYASDDQPRVIEIMGSFDVPRLDVASNKTLVGVGSDAVLNGGIRIRGYDDAPIQNVIFRNLTVNGATTQVDDDAMQVYFAHHVWIDHCDVYDGRDGNLDLTHAVNWVTVSWTRFHYTSNYARPEGESADHRFSSLVGHSDDNAGEDDGRLKISFHHNWWDDGVIERMPRVRFGEVHVYNNYFSSSDSNYCVRAGVGAHLLVEANYFDNVNSPHEFNEDDASSAHITARDNEYDNTTGEQATGGEGTPFTEAPYILNLDAATAVKELVRTCAGPR